MGKCLSKQKTSQKKEVTISIFGLDSSGKTAVTKVLKRESQNDTAPTVGFSTIQLKWKRHLITILDVGGGARIRNIWKNYYAESYGLIYVVDASDRGRISEAAEELAKVLSDERIQGKPVLLLLNKQDTVGAIDESQAVEQMKLEPLVNTNKCPCRVETISAMCGTGRNMDSGLNEGFDWLVRYIHAHYYHLSSKISRDMEAQRAQLAKEKEERMERIRKAKEERGENSDDEQGEPGEAPKVEEQRICEQAPTVVQLPNGSDRMASSLPPRPASVTARMPPSNGHIPNRNNRRVRPSSAGQASALVTLTTSYQASIVPHLPPILSPRPAPKLPTSTDIPPPATPPPIEHQSQTVAAPAFPQPPHFVNVSSVQPEKEQDESQSKSKQGGRKRRKRRLQRFNKTAPSVDTVLQEIERQDTVQCDAQSTTIKPEIEDTPVDHANTSQLSNDGNPQLLPDQPSSNIDNK